MSEVPDEPFSVAESVRTLAQVLDMVRSGRARTRPEIVRRSGLARNLVSDRVEQLVAAGLLADGDLAPSTGGRPPRELRFRADSGHILVAELGATRMGVGIADLSGRLLISREEPIDIKVGPVEALALVDSMFTELLSDTPRVTDVWGIGIGLPGPVEWHTGRPVAPPIMPGWDGFDVRGFFASRYRCPVWVDNDVNVMATGEVRAGVAQGHDNVIYVKVGTGIGSGIFSRGQIHRGAQGAAGDIGHLAVPGARAEVICRCGNIGCLEAMAGGAALIRDAALAAEDARSTHLAETVRSGREITSAAIIEAALYGDPVAMEMLSASAVRVGEAVASMVNMFNPSIIVIGGSLGRSLDMYLATVHRVVLSRSLPLATRSLQITTSPLGDKGGLIGAAYTVVDELLSPEVLASWLPLGRPSELAQLSA